MMRRSSVGRGEHFALGIPLLLGLCAGCLLDEDVEEFEVGESELAVIWPEAYYNAEKVNMVWPQEVENTSAWIAWAVPDICGMTQAKIQWDDNPTMSSPTIATASRKSSHYGGCFWSTCPYRHNVYWYEITGLTKNTRYYYQVKEPCNDHASKVQSFKTRGVLGSELAFEFGVWGDTRDGLRLDVANNVATNSSFVLGTGDYVPDGGSNWSQWHGFIRTVNATVGAKGSFPVFSLGNHDIEDGPPGLHYMQPLDGHPIGQGRYDFYWNNVYVLVVNSNDHSSQQTTWVRDRLTAARANPAIDWIFVVHHHPPFNAGGHDDDGYTKNTLLKPIYNAPNICVDGVFSGHEHNLQYDEGTSYTKYIPTFVVGGGGAPLTSANDNGGYEWIKRWATQDYGYGKVKVNGAASWTFEFHRGSGVGAFSKTFSKRTCQ